MNKKRVLLWISSFFIFIFAAVVFHLYFIKSNQDFYIPSSDTSWQFIPYQVMLLKEFLSGNIFWSWKYGLGGDLWGGFSYYYSTSPFLWIMLLFIKNPDYVELMNARLPLSIVKSFLAMVALFGYLRYNKVSFFPSVVGSLIFAGSLIYILRSLQFDYMNDSMIILPLLLLSVDVYFNKNKKIYLVIMVAITCFTNFYFSYITTIILFIYSLCKILDVYGTFKEKLRKAIDITVLYIIGLLISCISFIPAVYAFLLSDRLGNSSNNIPWLFGWDFYKSIFYRLFIADDPLFKFSYFQLGFPIAVFFLVTIGLIFFRGKRKDIQYFMYFIIALYLTPKAYSIFNGFSAPQSRWYFAFVFGISIYSAFVLHWINESDKKFKYIAPILSIIALLFIMNRGFMVGDSVKLVHIPLIIFVVSLAILFFLYKPQYRKTITILITGVIFTNIAYNNLMYSKYVLGHDMNQIAARPELKGYPAFQNEEVLSILRDLEGTEEFHRTIINSGTYNSPMIQWYNGTSTYQSLVDKHIHQFFKKELSIFHAIDTPSLYRDFDDRIYLESLFNVKYKIIWSGRQSYISPLYEKSFETPNFKVYKNPYNPGLAIVYNQYISEEEFDQLTSSEKRLHYRK